MKYSCIGAFSLMALATGVASAAEPAGPAEPAPQPTADVSPTAPAEAGRSFGDIAESFEIHLGVDAAGPLLFKDTPEGKLEELSVFQYGGHATFMLGTELLDLHRIGIGFAYASTATSPSRDLHYLQPYLAYEIGHPLILKVELGGNIAIGGEDAFASNYTGFLSGAALRYSFRRPEHDSSVGVALGVGTKFVVAASSLQYSTAFFGAHVEFIYHSE